MNITLNNSAIKTISASHLKAANAAQSIVGLSTQKNELGSGDITTPIINLKEAELENAAGVKLLQTEKKMLGSILDINA
jgi:hypothetical protein